LDGIINSITKLHLVGISTESSTMHGSMNIKYMAVFIRLHLYWKRFPVFVLIFNK